MLVSCLCPTYRRPGLARWAVAWFMYQDYPERELILLDDYGDVDLPDLPANIHLVQTSRRFRSLPEKYNALAGLARGSLLAVWEDDDIYHPWHLSAAVEALRGRCDWSKPSRVFQEIDHGPRVERQDKDFLRRFHASIVIDRRLFDTVGGWPITKRADYDRQFQRRMLAETKRPPVDPLEVDSRISYVNRYGFGSYCGSQLMTGDQDEDWYERV